ncbi:fimbrial protein [Metapseudomonas boanensis]|uniref:Fimbrial protein n=1 Tax=Metapseudomonas boanensis TaxID=2822138 RepID=A0ABS5XFD5_9GAMM|nr:fimbrial protein [Pseudomonas boanensis]MBT8765983.1 fimbrial protein [Pseudomonas boanensis]
MRLTLFAITALLACWYTPESPAAYSQYACDTIWGSWNVQQLGIDESVLVPKSVPAGTIFWRSPEQHLDYNCWLGPKAFSTYFFLNPNNTNLGPDVDVGVTLNGRDYLTSSKQKVLAHYFHANNTFPGQIELNDFRYYTTSVYLVKKSAAGLPEKDTKVSLSSFTLYRIGKEDMSIAQSLSVRPGRLDTGVIPCQSTVSISPTTIDFGNVSSSNATAGQEIARRTFRIAEQRTCTSPTIYGLNGMLTPTSNATLADNQGTLVPNDNSSVGISVFDQESQNPIPFERQFTITPRMDTAGNVREFEASLKWRTSAPKLGEFNAGAVLEAFYR